MSVAHPVAAPHAHVPHAPSAVRTHPLLRMDNVVLGLSVVLMFVQLRGGLMGELALMAAIPIAAAATFAADRRYLAALLLLCIPSQGVLTEAGAGPFVFEETVRAVPLAGVEVTATLVILAAAFGRVLLELLRGGRAFRGIVPRPLTIAFMLALVPVFLGGLQGQAMGNNQWSLGLRAMFALGGMFWGVIVARRAAAQPLRLMNQLATIVFVACAMLAVRFLNDMLIFCLLGLAGGLLPYYVSRRRWVEAGTLAAAAAIGAVALSLTAAGQVVVGLGGVVLAAIRSRTIRRTVLRLAVLVGSLASAGMLWFVVQMQGKTLLEVVQRDEGVFTYAIFKLLGDRGPLWLAALQQISAPPYWVVPAGRSLRPENFNYGYIVYLWDFGSHNTFLELLRQVGLVAGAVGIALMLWTIAAAVRVLTETRPPVLRGLAAGFLGVAVVGMTTGNFPVYDVGFFVWSLGGMLAGLWPEAPRRDEGSPPPAGVEDTPVLAGAA